MHGYDERESRRLEDQAGSLVDLLHADTAYPPGSRVLEAGCGVGAQTVTLASNSPGAHFVAIDVSADSLARAQTRVAAAGVTNVEFRQADLFALDGGGLPLFDHVFVCFVLEHLAEPVKALVALRQRLRPGGTMTVIEGDHGMTRFQPESAAARHAIDCLVRLQRERGGNADIGRQIYPLMRSAGLVDVKASPRIVYADSSRPALIDGFTKRTFIAMVEGVREPALGAGLTTAEAFDAGIAALYRTAEPGGFFAYTFFKGVGRKAKASR